MSGENSGNRSVRVLTLVALVSTLSFLLVGSSGEFSDYSRVPIPQAVFYVAALASGALLGPLWAGRGLVLAAAAAALVPGIVHATAMVMLHASLGGIALRDVIVLIALQRLLAYWLLLGMLVLAGTGLGLLIRGLVRRGG